MIKTNFGIASADILVPNKNVNFTKWATLACDQYSSQPSYWNRVQNFIGDSPSAFNLIFPEAFLESVDKEEFIEKINSNMKKYIDENIFDEYKNSIFYIERSFKNGDEIRRGLIAALDLEYYDFSKNSKSYIRATEGTILERIPPRVEIRKNADIELPHILILLNDKDCSIIERFENLKDDLDMVYDFNLIFDSGNLKAFNIQDENLIKKVFSDIWRLKGDGDLLFAVGDGNHSLATAKTIWEDLKKDLSEEEMENHPARFALVELNNVYDESILFEPIHRVVFDADFVKFIEGLKKFVEIEISEEGDIDTYKNFANSIPEKQAFYIFNNEKKFRIDIIEPDSNITAGTVENYLNKFCMENEGVVDYIHGVESTVELGSKDGNIGIILPNISKDEFFSTVINDGSFPRKTFSMGEAEEKRFYMEAKKIK